MVQPHSSTPCNEEEGGRLLLTIRVRRLLGEWRILSEGNQNRGRRSVKGRIKKFLNSQFHFRLESHTLALSHDPSRTATALWIRGRGSLIADWAVVTLKSLRSLCRSTSRRFEAAQLKIRWPTGLRVLIKVVKFTTVYPLVATISRLEATYSSVWPKSYCGKLQGSCEDHYWQNILQNLRPSVEKKII